MCLKGELLYQTFFNFFYGNGSCLDLNSISDYLRYNCETLTLLEYVQATD